MRHTVLSCLLALAASCATAQDTIDTSRLFRIYNPTREKFIIETFDSHEMLSALETGQLWRFVDAGGGLFAIQNAVTGNMMCTPDEDWSQPYATSKAGKTDSTAVYAISKNVSKSDSIPHYNIKSISSNKFAHLDAGGVVVNWRAEENGTVDASDWMVIAADDEQMAAIAGMQQLYAHNSQMLDAQPKHQAVLNEMFHDAACTRVKEMSDEAFAQKAEALPALLREMATKVRSGQWASLGTSGRDWDKTFRIGRYNVYSNHQAMADALKVSYWFGRLSNPTGISLKAGETAGVLVGDEFDLIPTDSTGKPLATLCAEIVPDDSITMRANGMAKELHKGLNYVIADQPSQLFIYYEINDAENDESRFLDNFPQLTIQVAGGRVYGYFDAASMTDEDWRTMLSDSLFNGTQHVQMKHEHVLMNFSRQGLLSVEQNRREILPLLNCYNNFVKWEEELAGLGPMWDHDDYYYHTERFAKRYRNLWNATSCAFDYGYLCAYYYGTYYNNYSLNETANAERLTKVGSTCWGTVHEIGHCYQAPITMTGMTEVSNNLFSNVMIYRLGTATSGGKGMSVLPTFYEQGKHWIDLGIWTQTQLYWKLYQYFHLAGHKTDFFPRLFDELRKKPFARKYEAVNEASEDYLHFALACCRVANADMSDLFECFGFFRPLSVTDTIDGTACRKVDDYNTYYLHVDQQQVERAKAEMKRYKKKIPNLVFIDDHIVPTPATYDGAKEGEMRVPNGNPIGSQGCVGQWTSFSDAGYKRAGKSTAEWAINHDGTIEITMTPGEGDVGYKVLDKQGRLVYFTSFSNFALPAGYTPSNCRIMAADAKGRDAKVMLRKSKAEASYFLMRDIYKKPVVEGTDYRIQYVTWPDYIPAEGPHHWHFIYQDGKVKLLNADDGMYIRLEEDSEGRVLLKPSDNPDEATAFTVVNGEEPGTYILDVNNWFSSNPNNAIRILPY